MTDTNMNPTTADFEGVYDLIMAGWASQAVRALAALSVAEHLADGPLSAADLAAREGCREAAMYRLLRAGAALGLLHRHPDGRFQATPRLSVLDGRSSPSLKHYAQAAISPVFWLPALGLADAVRRGEPQAQTMLGCSVFEWMGSHPEDARQFAAAMSELSEPIIREAVTHIDTSTAESVVDIGGAEGAFAAALLAAEPRLRGVVLELPHAVDAVSELAERLGLSDRLRGVAGDFMETIPPADLYLLKFILHDWDDTACLRILSNIRGALHPQGRLWIVEMAADSSDVPVALATMDMAMLFAAGGGERELSQFESLLARAGLAPRQTIALTSPYHLIEATLA